MLKQHRIGLSRLNILLVAYKAEQQLDLYARDPLSKKYTKILSYEVCASSGKPGPKRRRGDSQVPEGFYYIDRFNPASSYHLSLGVSYPNRADRIRSGTADPGGDIFIHGRCVTIGCLPMTDDKIREIYVCAIQASQSGQKKIPVYIFPFKMTRSNMEKYSGRYPANRQFWQNLETGYKLFHQYLTSPVVTVNTRGEYLFNR